MMQQGLLGAMAQPQQPQAQQPGLLGAMGGGAPQQGGASQQDIQLAMQLAQNPTPQMAQQVVQQLKQAGNPNAAQLEQVLSQAGNDSEFIKHIADLILQKMQGQV
jgi:hypothetical protein